MICPNCNQYVPDTNYRCPHCRKALKHGIDPLDFQQKPQKRKAQNVTFLVLALIVIGFAVVGYLVLFKETGTTNVNPETGKPSPVVSRDAKAVPSQPQNERDTGNIPTATSPARDTQEMQPGADTETGNETEPSANEESLKPDAGETGEKENGEKTDDPYAWANKEDPETLAKSHVPGEEIDIEKLLQAGKTTIFDFYSEYCPPCRKISPALAKLDAQRKDIVVVKININRKGVQGIDWNSPVARQYGLRSIPHFVIYDSTGYRTHEGEEAYQQVMNLLSQEGIQ